MPVELVKEKWVGKVAEVTIGATKEQGGTRTSTITIGGETTLPFLQFEGAMPNKPRVAMEIWDRPPTDWPAVLTEPFGDAIKDPASWAKKCVEFGAEAICLRLVSIDPEGENAPAEEATKAVKAVLQAVGVPLIIRGCGNFEKDNVVMPKVSEAAAGENCLLGIAEQDNYKSLVAASMMNNHCLIPQAPIDINIQKQLNILVTEMGMKPEKIVMDPTTGGVGYGIEYTYSIMERIRLGALQGDKMLAMPMVVFAGQEAWRAKEAKEPTDKAPEWGPQERRGPLWEIITATTLLQAGADLLVMRHPEAVSALRKHIDKLMKAKA